MARTSTAARDYEKLVAAVIAEMGEFKGAVVYRNRRYEGVRQPGVYEIDIAVEHDLFGRLKLFYLIECKRLSRPVDRPAVQKLAQTRDALSAHKAIIVSISGFSSEAVAVAESLGIALWTLTPERFAVVRGLSGLNARDQHIARLRETVGALMCRSESGATERLMSVEPATLGANDPISALVPPRFGSTPGVDPRTARYALIRDILRFLAQRDDDRSLAVIARIEEDMREAGMPIPFNELIAFYPQP